MFTFQFASTRQTNLQAEIAFTDLLQKPKPILNYRFNKFHILANFNSIYPFNIYTPNTYGLNINLLQCLGKLAILYYTYVHCPMIPSLHSQNLGPSLTVAHITKQV